VCWIWLDQKIDGASGCLHSCMHCGEAQGDTMEACVPHAAYCWLYNLVWTSLPQDFGLKLNWEAPMGSDLVYSFCLQNGTLIRPASTRFVIGLQSHVPAESIVQVSLWRRLIYGGG
jgi:hypothetical protein